MTAPTLSNRVVQQRQALGDRPALGFAARNLEELEEWRDGLRRRLWDLLGGPGSQADPAPCFGEVVAGEGFTRQHVTFSTEPGVLATAWLLRPEGAPANGAGLLALHGHGAGKDDVVGLSPSGDPAEAGRIGDHNYAFAAEFARRGYTVLAPDARGFGERAEGSEGGCHVPDSVALWSGRPIAGQRLWDDIQALSLLASLDGVHPSRLGCAGLSEGGKRTLFLAALDDRVEVAVISGYFTTLAVEVEAWDRLLNWDLCNQVPGLLRWADLPDIAALIAPRHLLVENGRDDDLYTLAGVERGMEVLRSAWGVAGNGSGVAIDLFEGGHRWSGRLAYDFISEALSGATSAISSRSAPATVATNS